MALTEGIGLAAIQALSSEMDRTTVRGWSHGAVALVAKALDSLGIANALWGNLLLCLYGVPTMVDVCHPHLCLPSVVPNVVAQGASFLVEDDRLDQAVSILDSIGFTACHDLDCHVIRPERVSASPARHLHLHTSEDVLELHRHSDFLWNVVALNAPTNATGPGHDIMLASDSSVPMSKLGGGCGPFSTDLYPIRIPTAHRYTEAAILLMLKHCQSIQTHFWASMLTYIEEYVIEKDRLDTRMLRPSHRVFLDSCRSGKMPMREIMERLESQASADQEISHTQRSVPSVL